MAKKMHILKTPPLTEKQKEAVWQYFLQNPNSTQREMARHFNTSMYKINAAITPHLKKKTNKESEIAEIEIESKA